MERDDFEHDVQDTGDNNVSPFVASFCSSSRRHPYLFQGYYGGHREDTDGRESEEKGGKEEHGHAVFRGAVVFMHT
jgi:hypothetical protein